MSAVAFRFGRFTRLATDPRSRVYTGSLMLQGGGALLGLVVQSTLARWLGVSGYGVVSTVMALTTILALFGTLGTNGAAIRYVPQFEMADDPVNSARFVSFSFSTTLFASLVIAVVFCVVAVTAHTRLTPLEAVGGGALLIVTSAQLACTDLGRLANRFTRAYGSVLVVRPLVIAVCVVSFIAVGVHPSVTLALVVLTVGAFIGFLIQVDAIRRGFGWSALLPVRPRREWLRSSPAFLIISAFQLVLAQVDLLAVSAFLTSTAVGYYSAALKMAAVLTLPTVAVAAVIRPKISALAGRGEIHDEAIRLISYATLWSGASTALIAAPMILWPEQFLRVFGRSFGAAAFALQMQAVGQLALVFMGLGGTVLIFMDRRRVVIVGTLVCTIVSAVACGAGAQLGGIDGAAVASALSDLLIGAVMYVLAWHYTGIRVSIVESLVPRWRRRLEPATSS